MKKSGFRIRTITLQGELRRLSRDKRLTRCERNTMMWAAETVEGVIPTASPKKDKLGDSLEWLEQLYRL